MPLPAHWRVRLPVGNGELGLCINCPLRERPHCRARSMPTTETATVGGRNGPRATHDPTPPYALLAHPVAVCLCGPSYPRPLGRPHFIRDLYTTAKSRCQRALTTPRPLLVNGCLAGSFVTQTTAPKASEPLPRPSTVRRRTSLGHEHPAQVCDLAGVLGVVTQDQAQSCNRIGPSGP